MRWRVSASLDCGENKVFFTETYMEGADLETIAVNGAEHFKKHTPAAKKVLLTSVCLIREDFEDDRERDVK